MRSTILAPKAEADGACALQVHRGWSDELWRGHEEGPAGQRVRAVTVSATARPTVRRRPAPPAAGGGINTAPLHLYLPLHFIGGSLMMVVTRSANNRRTRPSSRATDDFKVSATRRARCE